MFRAFLCRNKRDSGPITAIVEGNGILVPGPDFGKGEMFVDTDGEVRICADMGSEFSDFGERDFEDFDRHFTYRSGFHVISLSEIEHGL